MISGVLGRLAILNERTVTVYQAITSNTVITFLLRLVKYGAGALLTDKDKFVRLKVVLSAFAYVLIFFCFCFICFVDNPPRRLFFCFCLTLALVNPRLLDMTVVYGAFTSLGSKCSPFFLSCLMSRIIYQTQRGKRNRFTRL